MRIVKTVTINGREVTLNELTVEEVANLLDSLDSGLIDVMFDGRLPLTVVCKSCGIKKKALEKWFPADLDELIKEVEAVNPHSARLCQTLINVSRSVVPNQAPQSGATAPK